MAHLRSRVALGLARTRDLLLTDVTDLFSGKIALTDDLLNELEDRLLEADLGVDTVMEIRDRLQGDLRGKKSSGPDEVLAAMADVIERILTPGVPPKGIGADLNARPHVVLFVGVNGSGKTTTIGKLAHAYRSAGKKVIVAAADTYRAAAVDQLVVWAGRAGADCVRSHEGADAASVAWDALDAAIARDMDVLLVDTAGRLHTHRGLMGELEKIKRVLAGRLEGAPHETLLVLDATTGQNALVQGEEFSKSVDVTGLILTKLDGTARGGVIVPLARKLEIPVQMVGVGEDLDSLMPFDAREFTAALLTREMT
ncbi:signal recognition particle-docking protein FtsY [Gemmatimonadota bacterium]